MVDIHSHILPGLDDGAATLEDSIQMVRMAGEAGTTDIVATPHANLEFRFEPSVVEQKAAELRAAVGDSPRIYTGCDFHLSYDNIQDAIANPLKYAVNQKCYLLVEFSDLLIFRTTREIFEQLRMAGLIPIVTHPERNPLLQQRIEHLEEWVSEGCLLQVTGQSFLGKFGSRAREFADLLMKRRLVHVVASDAHDTVHRTTRLDGAYQHVARKFGESVAERLFVAGPSAVLRGESIELPQDLDPVPERKWYRFW